MAPYPILIHKSVETSRAFVVSKVALSRRSRVSAMATSTASTSAALYANFSASRSSSIAGSSLNSARPSSVSPKPVVPVSCRAHKLSDGSEVAMSRRSVMSLAVAGAAAVAAIAAPALPAQAAYGEAANIFGSPKKDTGFVTYSGDGFKVDVPSKWNPSKEKEFPGTVLRYEDNFDSNSNLAIMVLPAAKSSIKDYGPPEKFLESVSYLLGKQAYSGKTQSEGGFDPNAVATAAILESSTPVINGKEYYNISLLTRTADGDEGGKHQVIVATVSGGKLYLLKTQAGDKRWFKGARKSVEGVASSFSVV